MGLLKGSFFVLIIRVIGLLMQLMVFGLISRIHTLEEVGLYAVINAIWLITRTMGSMGFDQAAMRFLPNYIANNEIAWIKVFVEKSRKYITQVQQKLFVGLSCIMFLLYVIGGTYTEYVFPLFILSLGIPAYAFIGLEVCALRAQEKVFSAQLPESIGIQTLLALGLSLSYLTSSTTVEVTLMIQVASAWIILFIYRFIQNRLITQYNCDNNIFNFKEVRKMAASSFKGMAATALSSRIAVPLIIISGSASMAGVFEGALRIGLLGTIITWAVGVVVSPMIARAAAEIDTKSVQKLYFVAGVIQTMPAALVLICIIFMGDWLLVFLFGASFESAYIVAVTISVATLINATCGVASNYLLMTGGEKTVEKYSKWGLIAIFIGVPLGVVTCGINGAALALVARSIIRDVGMTVFVAKKYKLTPYVLR